MVRTLSMGTPHGFEIAPVGSFTGAVDIGGERALMALHDVIAAPARGRAGSEAEDEHSREARHGEHRQQAYGDAGKGPLGVRRSTAWPRRASSPTSPAVAVSTPPWKTNGRQMSASFTGGPGD